MSWKQVVNQLSELSEEELRQLTLDRQLEVLRARHETLGGAYRDACEELTRLRKEHEDCRGRLHAIHVLSKEAAP